MVPRQETDTRKYDLSVVEDGDDNFISIGEISLVIKRRIRVDEQDQESHTSHSSDRQRS